MKDGPKMIEEYLERELNIFVGTYGYCLVMGLRIEAREHKRIVLRCLDGALWYWLQVNRQEEPKVWYEVKIIPRNGRRL